MGAIRDGNGDDVSRGGKHDPDEDDDEDCGGEDDGDRCCTAVEMLSS